VVTSSIILFLLCESLGGYEVVVWPEPPQSPLYGGDVPSSCAPSSPSGEDTVPDEESPAGNLTTLPFPSLNGCMATNQRWALREYVISTLWLCEDVLEGVK